MNKLRIFIIILNLNHSDMTIECLRSLEKLKLPDITLSVSVIDNGSKAEDLKKLKKFNTVKFDLSIVENCKNMGFSEGNNKGIKLALNEKSDYLLFLNNDTFVAEDFLVELSKKAENHPEVGIFTPKIYFAKGYEYKKDYKKDDLGHVIWSLGGAIDWNNVYASNRYVDVVDKGQLEKSGDVDFATGAAMFVRAWVFEKYKGFDPKYFLYLEDADLCQRYKNDGFKILTVPKAIVWHKVSQSSGIGSDLNDYFITRNRLIFAMKYAGLRAKLAVLRESATMFFHGRKWQKRGVMDFYLQKLGAGSWNEF